MVIIHPLGYNLKMLHLILYLFGDNFKQIAYLCTRKGIISDVW